MTKKQREQVVELLRCAADDRGAGEYGPLGLLDALVHCDLPHGLEWQAWDAYDDVKTHTVGGYRAELLEAAARVEEGSWP